jgi:hypothetical protein
LRKLGSLECFIGNYKIYFIHSSFEAEPVVNLKKYEVN